MPDQIALDKFTAAIVALLFSARPAGSGVAKIEDFERRFILDVLQ
jgi:hypothetical protein